MLLDALYLCALALLSPWLFWRAYRTGRYRSHLRPKLRGHESTAVPPGAVWFHAVSVGEVHVLRTLVAVFRQRFPAVPVVVSSTTDTGLAEAKKIFPDVAVIVFPFDFTWAVRRTLDAVKPSLVVLCESELWPNFVRLVKSRNLPLAVVNGRLSPRSLSRYKLVAPLVRKLFASPDLWAMQTDEYAAAVLSLGGTPGRVVVTGNVKYDGAATDRDGDRPRQLRRFYAVENDDLVWVVGSTQPPEDEIAIAMYPRLVEKYPRLRLFLVPRSPDRFDAVAQLLQASGLPFLRRSAMDEADGHAAPVTLIDTIGELGALWALADVAYVGGSMDGKRGGQNMIEPAAARAATTFGPHVWNFREASRLLCAAGGALIVADAAEWEATTARLLGDAGERGAMADEARRFVRRQQGATARTVEALGELLPRATAEAA